LPSRTARHGLNLRIFWTRMQLARITPNMQNRLSRTADKGGFQFVCWDVVTCRYFRSDSELMFPHLLGRLKGSLMKMLVHFICRRHESAALLSAIVIDRHGTEELLEPILQALRSRVEILMRSLDFFLIYLISPAALGLGFTQPVTQMSTRNRKVMFLGSKVRRLRRADNLTAIFESIVYKMWEPRQASTACYKHSFIFFITST
jgi:hypothetical protein